MHLLRDALPRSQRGSGVSRVVIGMGNPFRRDDGAGVEVARRLRQLLPRGVTILEHDGEPAGLLDVWQGAAEAYVVDSVRGVDPGSVHQVHLSAQTGLAIGQERGSTHALGLGDAVELAAFRPPAIDANNHRHRRRRLHDGRGDVTRGREGRHKGHRRPREKLAVADRAD